ncbi:MAG TPA: NAD(P)H-hydrate dehydratase [Candidatus Humimicrobiaceae bacterium]
MDFTDKNKLVKILKGSHVADIDRKCIDRGIDPKLLMKNAGTKISDFISCCFGTGSEAEGPFVIDDIDLKKYPLNQPEKNNITGTIVCGGGNNGGDGFVCAINLVKQNYQINVFYLVPPQKLKPDCSFYFNELKKMKTEEKPDNLNLVFFSESSESEKSDFKESLKNSSFIVDAIFGTGLHENMVHGSATEIIGFINDARKDNKDLKIFSIDIPSGIDSDNGKVLGVAVKADFTVTFGVKKLGIVNFPGLYYSGQVEIADIGIPQEFYDEYEKYFEANLEWVAAKIPERSHQSHKHSIGKLLVVAGSLGFTGAAYMVCEAAMRTGAGIVTLVCPWELNYIFETKLTEVMTLPVEQTEEGSLHFNAFSEILDESSKYDAIAIGPGLSRNPSTVRLVREILKKIKIPTVLDADGLKALSSPMDMEDEELYSLGHVVITPHHGEMSSILSRVNIGFENRFEANQEAAKKFNAVSLLKGPSTIITNPEGVNFINTTGDFALATAGTGDVLTGIIGSLLCQGMDLTSAAVCGAHIHGLASDIISKETSKTSLIASDLFEGIKKVFLEIEKQKY